jgi:hypothetical protein
MAKFTKNFRTPPFDYFGKVLNSLWNRYKLCKVFRLSLEYGHWDQKHYKKIRR